MVAVLAAARAVRLLVAHVARARALLQHERAVRMAVARHGPLRAVVLLVKAEGAAHAARDRARGEDRRVLLALAAASPVAAVLRLLVVALDIADLTQRAITSAAAVAAQHAGGSSRQDVRRMRWGMS